MIGYKYVLFFLGLLVVLGMAGCGSTSASGYLSIAEKRSNCEGAIWNYKNAIGVGLRESNVAVVAKAVERIKSLAGSCNQEPEEVIDGLARVSGDLAEAKHRETGPMVELYLEYAARHPSAKVWFNVYQIDDLYAINKAQGKRVLGLSLSRSLEPYTKYQHLPSELLQDYDSEIQRLQHIETAAQAQSSLACNADHMFMSMFCESDSGLQEKYYLSYAREARRLGAIERAVILERKADLYAQPRYEERVARNSSGDALIGGLLQAAGQIAQASGSGQGYESGLLMQGVGAALAGDDAAAQQAVASVRQYGANGANVQSRFTSAAVGEPALATATDECLMKITKFGRPCREPNSVYKPSVQTECVFMSPPGSTGGAELINKCGYDVAVFVCYKDGGSLQPCREDYGGGTVYYPILKSNEQSYTVYPARPMRSVVCKHTEGNYRYFPNIVFSGSDFKANCIASNWDGKY